MISNKNLVRLIFVFKLIGFANISFSGSLLIQPVALACVRAANELTTLKTLRQQFENLPDASEAIRENAKKHGCIIPTEICLKRLNGNDERLYGSSFEDAAFSTSFQGKNYILLSPSITAKLESGDKRDLVAIAVLKHELGHLENEDPRKLKMLYFKGIAASLVVGLGAAAGIEKIKSKLRPSPVFNKYFFVGGAILQFAILHFVDKIITKIAAHQYRNAELAADKAVLQLSTPIQNAFEIGFLKPQVSFIKARIKKIYEKPAYQKKEFKKAVEVFRASGSQEPFADWLMKNSSMRQQVFDEVASSNYPDPQTRLESFQKAQAAC